MIRLVCIDMDGTLVGSNAHVHPSVWPAAERASERGIHLAVCSGRPAFGITRGYAERLDADGWHVFQIGASVVHLASGRSLSTPIARATVEMLVARARETGRDLELYTDTEYVVERDSALARRHAALLGVPLDARGYAQVEGRVVRAQWLVSFDETETVLGEPHAGLELSPSSTPAMPETSFINMTPVGIDKSTGVRAIAHEYGVSLDEVMYVGDGLNDVSAMRICGWPVAMANGDREAIEIARRVVGHVDEGGLAEALEMALIL